MTEAEAILAVLDAFPGVRVESCLAGTQREAMALAVRRQNASRGAERRIGEAHPRCRTSALPSAHGAQEDRTAAVDQAPPAQDAPALDLFAQAV